MKHTDKTVREETITSEHESTPIPGNEFHDRAMTLIEEQLPVSIALGRDGATAGMLRTLHLIAGGNPHEVGPLCPPPNGTGACNKDRY